MMNNIWSVLSPCIRRSLRLLVLAIALVATANGQIIDETPTATGLSAEILQSRIDQLRESSAYDEETRIAALELYQRAVANLSAAAAYDESAERFSRSITEAPAEAVLPPSEEAATTDAPERPQRASALPVSREDSRRHNRAFGIVLPSAVKRGPRRRPKRVLYSIVLLTAVAAIVTAILNFL